MKKVFRLLVMAAFVCGMTAMVGCGSDDEDDGGNGGNGGNNVVNPENLPTTLNETFDNGVPTNWGNIDADGDGYKWQNFYYNQSGGQTEPDGTVNSASYYNVIGPLSPDNYLVTPKLWIEDGAKLTYDIVAADAYFDHYSVLIGNMENGSFVSVATLLEEDVPSTDVTTRTIDLSQYKGNGYCISFRHHNSYDEYVMKLDNVVVGKSGKAANTTMAPTPKNALKVK